MSRQLVKCPKCGWVHFVSSFEEMGQNVALSEEDKARLQRCFQCGAPSSDFVAARHGDVPMLATLQGVVVPDSLRATIPPKDELFGYLARVCMFLKCIEADADFYEEVASLVADLTPADCERAIKIVRADRELPDELKEMIEGYRLEARYDYLLDALTVRGIARDDGQAASMHLASGRPIYYGDDAYPDAIIREYPDGRKQLVSLENYVVSVIRELPR